MMQRYIGIGVLHTQGVPHTRRVLTAHAKGTGVHLGSQGMHRGYAGGSQGARIRHTGGTQGTDLLANLQ